MIDYTYQCPAGHVQKDNGPVSKEKPVNSQCYKCDRDVVLIHIEARNQKSSS